MLTPSINSDLWYYFDLSRKMVSGLLPYVEFRFEYPPLAILPIWIPGLFKSQVEGYVSLYRFILCTFDLAFLFFFHHRFSLDPHYKRFILLSSLISILLAPLLYDRLDFLFGLILFATAYFANEKGLFWALLGIPFKLISAIFVPFYVVSFFQQRNFNPKNFLKYCALPLGILLIMILALFQLKFLDFLSYHHSRGIQIESTWASLHYLLQLMANSKMEIEYSFGAQHIKQVPGWIFMLANYLVIAFLALLLLIFTLKRNPLPEVFVTALLVFLCFSKVLSPQFLIWLIPLIFFFIDKKIQLIFFVIIAALSGYVFIHYGELMAQEAWAWWCINLRNGLLISWVTLRFRGHILAS
ncbi:MAG: hypothetical protein H0V66_08785 [Bdellovibrionales bacterium]|nr:hypothetical protein [Bdellovibrionales bacterium]